MISAILTSPSPWTGQKRRMGSLKILSTRGVLKTWLITSLWALLLQLAVPTPEHYLPMLYALALKTEEDTITYFNDKPLAGSLTMTSLIIQ